MENQVILGSDLMLFVNNKSVACATSCKLNITANTLEISSKDSGKWKTSKSGKLSYSATSDNLFVMNEYVNLVDLMIARTEVDIEFGIVNKTDDNGVTADGWQFINEGTTYKGKCIITSIDANASDGDNATFAISLEGCGALTKA